MKPVKDVVMCEYVPIDDEVKMTNSGILVETKRENANTKPIKTKVLAVGDEVKTVKEGDEIYYTKQYSVTKEIEGKKYDFLHEGDILVIL